MAQSVALYAMIGAALVIGALGAAMGVAADVVTIQNAAVAFQVDLLHGCSISAAWAVGDPSHTNLINTADLGALSLPRCAVCLPYTGHGGV